MIPDGRFRNLPANFWAYIRIIGEQIGYTRRGENKILAPEITAIKTALSKIGLKSHEIADEKGITTTFGVIISEYLDYRAKTLNDFVEPRLMDVKRAEREFKRLKKELSPRCPLPMNK